MGSLLTLVASTPHCPLTERHIRQAGELLSARVENWSWLRRQVAVDIVVDGPVNAHQRSLLDSCLESERIDLFIQPAGAIRRKRLLVADMDNTLVVGETLDDLSEYCGLKERIAAITDRTMRGELDFKAALRERVGLMAGLEQEAVHKTAEAIRLMPGAETLVATMKRSGAICAIVSGGFTCFTGHVAGRLGCQYNFGNELLFDGGKLSGQVADPIIDRLGKRQRLLDLCAELGLQPDQCLAVGDGANDLDMLTAAGLGVGFHPKPVLRAGVDNSILYGDLTALLFAQGYSEFC